MRIPFGAIESHRGARALHGRRRGRGAFTPKARSFALALLLLVVSVAPSGAQRLVSLEQIVYAGVAGVPFEVPQGVAIDPVRGEIAVANSGRGRIEILRADGRPTTYFEHRIAGMAGALVTGQPRSLCYDAHGHLWATDNLDSCVDVLDFRGRVAQRICIPAGNGVGPDRAAGAMARLHDGSMLVASRGDPARIHRFDGTGRWLASWGEAGAEPGRLSRITALAEAPNGEIVVTCDGTDLVVQRFNDQGKFLAGFGKHEIGPGNFSYPSGVAVTPDGRIWTSDELRQCVQVFDSTGNFLGMAGQGGSDPGSFLFPSGLASDGHGRVAVVERVGARLQMFRVVDATSAFREPERR